MAADEDDRPRPAGPAAPFTPRVLDGLGVAELDGYIAELRAEIARAEAEGARKRAMRDAALDVFKPRGGPAS